uniref:Tail protein n=1 Tax=viral metagenome TaxID=1070528 RepID=A0A6M3LZ45_9ZZZZ
MQNNSGFTLDSRDFLVKFKRVTDKVIPEAAAQAFREVAPLILADAITKEPKAPHDTGNLWRSQKVDAPKTSKNEVYIEYGFNAEYAGIVHEMPAKTNWTMPGSGPKFLETKLLMYGRSYFEKIAAKIKAAGKARDIA